MKTPQMTDHARTRCAEMGISTKVPKHIIQNANVTHTTSSRGRDKPRYVATSDTCPGYAAVYFTNADGYPVVCTVLFATAQRYDRQGATFSIRESA